jgi:hypoxanthine-DNA glycosylase
VAETDPIAFEPVVGPAPRVLVLGSFPGVRSLLEQQYYAHPRNGFWTIMGELVGAGPDLSYDERLHRLRSAGIALWDALHACRRRGSGDHAIERASEQPRELSDFTARHPTIALIGCNGRKSFEVTERHFRSVGSISHPPIVRLPSTSPAHAGLPITAKIVAWRQALMPYVAQSDAGDKHR